MSATKVGTLALLMFLGGAGPALAGLSAANGPCGDTVSAAVCMASDFVWGPSGLVPFATTEAAWAQSVVFGFLSIVRIPAGGWL